MGIVRIVRGSRVNWVVSFGGYRVEINMMNEYGKIDFIFNTYVKLNLFLSELRSNSHADLVKMEYKF